MGAGPYYFAFVFVLAWALLTVVCTCVHIANTIHTTNISTQNDTEWYEHTDIFFK